MLDVHVPEYAGAFIQKKLTMSEILRCSSINFPAHRMAEFTVPEILRSDPSSAVLSLLAMNITDILSLRFIDSPNKLSIVLALKDLAMLGAIDPDTLQVTAIGRAMSQTPLDPIYGR